ncbi:glycosyltransferase family 2 protein [Candidatus Woesearchaeota archaeon]|nr:glycosyltransferase family 2 protein [Candidatus Woesearchaeota archaeon]
MINLLNFFSSDNISAAITTIFLIIILSYYILLFIKPKKNEVAKKFSSITIIVPAHNEEEYIESCLKSVVSAKFNGKKEIILVDDGSIDNTFKLASKFKGIKIIRTKHLGKAASLNKALSHSTSELIAIVDGDSVIKEDALLHMAEELGRKNVAGACCVVKVKNRNKIFPMWSHIEQLYNSLMRSLFAKINANITTPGPLSVYRRKALEEIKGFSTEGFSEDVDVTIRLIRKGYHIGFSEKAISETNIPYDVKGFFRQRTRFARGLLNILKRHLQVNRTIIDLYTLPLFLFSYVQAVIMGSLTLYNIISGYMQYFVAKGIYFSLPVLKFFFEWFSLVGFVKWTYSVLAGTSPATFVAMVGIMSTLLSYPLFVFAILKFDRKIDLLHIIPFFFMFPFWIMIMTIYIIFLPEYFRKTQYNRWKKNE